MQNTQSCDCAYKPAQSSRANQILCDHAHISQDCKKASYTWYDYAFKSEDPSNADYTPCDYTQDKSYQSEKKIQSLPARQAFTCMCPSKPLPASLHPTVRHLWLQNHMQTCRKSSNHWSETTELWNQSPRVNWWRGRTGLPKTEARRRGVGSEAPSTYEESPSARIRVRSVRVQVCICASLCFQRNKLANTRDMNLTQFLGVLQNSLQHILCQNLWHTRDDSARTFAITCDTLMTHLQEISPELVIYFAMHAVFAERGRNCKL